MVLGYVHNLVKVKSGKYYSGQAQLMRKRGRRGKDVNVTHDDATVSAMFVRGRTLHSIRILMIMAL